MIDIFVDRRRTFESVRPYMLHAMLRGLERAGIPSRLVDKPGKSNGGEAAFLHVDLTDVPDDFLAAASRYDRCVNGGAATIRRTFYARARLQRGDEHSGPVIVKTVLNSRGAPELRYESRKSAAARASHIAKKILVPGYKKKLCPAYEVFESLDDVPAPVWSNPRLMVERFLPGAMQLPITKYRFNFFYELEFNYRASYDSLLCNSGTEQEFDAVPDVPDSIRDLRQALKLDYGAIDYFLIDGEAVPIDANKTVTASEPWVKKWPSAAWYVAEATDRLIEFARRG